MAMGPQVWALPATSHQSISLGSFCEGVGPGLPRLHLGWASEFYLPGLYAGSFTFGQRDYVETVFCEIPITS